MIQIEKTPNPNAVKFIGNKKFSSVGSQEFQSKNIGEVKNVKCPPLSPVLWSSAA